MQKGGRGSREEEEKIAMAGRVARRGWELDSCLHPTGLLSCLHRYSPMCLVPSEHDLGYNSSVNASNYSIKWENSADTRTRSKLVAASSP
ncbi:hypothetical protein Pmani_023679 [Petrolisthes manimaculis]|uniref:Uncharacterized protein n=1 Tax=Petrolisthes manimaculis TaxID=1843537 RepID=A0AAE1PBB2_9EUCA|nr:hypothetical protein Pmani_023679 [Petrolisthes manimaculis]